jgi:acyl-CoA synthetase (AMP-forming)/AMP-acid ligase II
VDDWFNALPQGAVGLLGFRAPWIPDRYVDNDKATTESFHEGWFYPDVEDAAVVAMSHAMAGEMPVALVVLRRPVTGEALTRVLRSRVDEGLLPTTFVEVPEIFRRADGKILRNRLLAEYGTPPRPST